MRLTLFVRRVLVLPALLLASSLLPSACFADTYRIVNLGTDAGVFLYGIADSGTVVLNDSLLCPGPCFDTYTNGTLVGRSATAGSLTFDDGTACTPAVSGTFVTEHAVCNNGLEAFTGYTFPLPGATGVYTGGNLASDFLAFGGEGQLMLNSVGDIVWDDHFSEEIYEAIDITSTVPEPATWVLLGTGVFVILAIRFRRVHSRAAGH